MREFPNGFSASPHDTDPVPLTSLGQKKAYIQTFVPHEIGASYDAPASIPAKFPPTSEALRRAILARNGNTEQTVFEKPLEILKKASQNPTSEVARPFSSSEYFTSGEDPYGWEYSKDY